MKKSSCKLSLLLVFVFLLATVFAGIPMGIVYANNTTYYVDSVVGNDSNNGTSTSSAWKNLSKVNNTTFSPGDKILFKAGGAWTGQLYPLGSGTSGSPIVVDMYGTGNKPFINGNRALNPPSTFKKRCGILFYKEAC